MGRGRVWFAASLILAAGLGVTAQTRTTLTHETLWSFKRVGAPVISPDGRWVVFPVSEVTYDPAQDVSDLWIVPADGSAPPRRLTSSKAGEGGPAWSPDSTKLAFTARRDGDDAGQVYVLDIGAGGDAQRVTNAPTSASTPKWSPDGKTIAFAAPMWNGAKDEDSNRKIAGERRALKSRVRIYDSFPIRNFDTWNEDSTTHIWLVEVAGDKKARSLLAGTKLAAGHGFSVTGGFAWAPDGRSIVFPATERNDASAREYVTSNLYAAGLTSGEPQRVSPQAIDAGTPEFSPDGRTICYVGSAAAPAIYHLSQLACTAWPAASDFVPPFVTKALDRSVGTWAFASDSRTIYFTAEDRGHERIYSVSLGASATPKLLADAPEGVYTNIQAARRSPTVVANWGSAISPPEIVRVDPTAGAKSALSSFNKAATASIDWAPLREFTSTGKGGRELHSFLALPPNFDPSRKYPLFVLIHGGHANMWRDDITYRWNYHLLAHPNFVVLMTDYRGSTGYGEKFTLDILGDPLAGPADDVNDAADAAIKQFSFIDGTRQCAGGASYGGHLANWLEGTTTRYKCLVSHAGLATLDMQWGTSDGIYHRELMMGGPFWAKPDVWNAQSPLAKAANFKTPMLLSVGDLDYRVPHGNALAMYSALQRMNVPSKLLFWPDENHWILKGENSRVFYREVRAWLEKYLK